MKWQQSDRRERHIQTARDDIPTTGECSLNVLMERTERSVRVQATNMCTCAPVFLSYYTVIHWFNVHNVQVQERRPNSAVLFEHLLAHFGGFLAHKPGNSEYITVLNELTSGSSSFTFADTPRYAKLRCKDKLSQMFWILRSVTPKCWVNLPDIELQISVSVSLSLTH